MEVQKPLIVNFKNRLSNGDYKSIKVRIDKSVQLNEVKKQLVNSRQLNMINFEGPIGQDVIDGNRFELFDLQSGKLVTEDAFSDYLEIGNSFELKRKIPCEVEEVLERLQSYDDKNLIRSTIFGLKLMIVEDETFQLEFLKQDGLAVLIRLIDSETGNILAYSLLAFHSLMTIKKLSISDEILNKLLNLFNSNALNISRPITAILYQYIQPIEPTTINSNEFNQVYQTILHSFLDILPILVERICSQEAEMATLSFQLMNSLIKGALLLNDLEFIELLEQAGLHQKITKLIPSAQGETLSSLSTLQPFLKTYYNQSQKLSTSIPRSNNFLEVIWGNTGFELSSNRNWIQVGFEEEAPLNNFEEIGLLGLRMMSYFSNSLEFHEIISKRGGSGGFPLVRISNTILLLLLEVIRKEQVDDGLNFILFYYYSICCSSLITFHRIWLESQSSRLEFESIEIIILSEIKNILLDSKFLYSNLSSKLSSINYRLVQSKLSNLNEPNKLDSINNLLQTRLRFESTQFIKLQRLNCLKKGNWFISTKKGYKIFYILSKNGNKLHWTERESSCDDIISPQDCESSIEMNLISDVSQKGSATFSTKSKGPILSPATQSLTLELYSTTSTLLTLIATNSIIFSEWLDGLNFLIESEKPLTKDSQGLIDDLVEIGMKIQLLDLSASIPSSWSVNQRSISRGKGKSPINGVGRDIPIAPPPEALFFYSEIV